MAKPEVFPTIVRGRSTFKTNTVTFEDLIPSINPLRLIIYSLLDASGRGQLYSPDRRTFFYTAFRLELAV